MFKLFKFKKKIPASTAERMELTRQLIRLRYDHDPLVRDTLEMLDVSIEDYEDSDEEMLDITCEASLMRIVEQYIINKELGFPDSVIIPYLNCGHAELMKSSGQDLPSMPEPYSLIRYIHHFMIHVHNQGVEVTPSFFPIGIRMVCSFYDREIQFE